MLILVHFLFGFTHRNKTLQTNALLTLDPNVSGVFGGPYPFGIDPVSRFSPASLLSSSGICVYFC